MAPVEPTFTILTIANLLFWVLAIGCGLYGIFTDSWQGSGGMFRKMEPDTKRKFYRTTGFILVFIGVWMVCRILL